MVKVRDGDAAANKAAYLVTGVDIDGFKHVLGIPAGRVRRCPVLGRVLAELRNRGIRGVLFVCYDGLPGPPEAIETAWPKAIVQTCFIHLIRAAMPYVPTTSARRPTPRCSPSTPP